MARNWRLDEKRTDARGTWHAVYRETSLILIEIVFQSVKLQHGTDLTTLRIGDFVSFLGSVDI